MDSAMVEKGLRKCPHGPCECMIYLEQRYCSNRCSVADRAEETEVQCDCGHLNCASKWASRGWKAPSALPIEISSIGSR